MKITQRIIPKSMWGIKCPHSMVPEYITIHETANDASAQNEIEFMQGNQKEVSFHFAVDDKEIMQGIPLDRNAWHAGDGSEGTGNRKSIAIEICYSKYGGEIYEQARLNAVQLTAELLGKYELPITSLKKHQDWSGKLCPHRMLSEGRWDDFLSRVKEKLLEKENENMGIKDSYTTEVYNGLTIQIARMGLDPDYEYKGTVVGKPFGPNAVQRSQSIDDPELEAAGWQSCGHTNGGIFYKEPSDNNWMASGIEVLMGNATQLWDTRFDSCAAIGFYHSGEMVIATQAEIKALAASGQLRGAVTAAFGVKLNGQRWTAGSEFNAQRDYIYSNKSGRTIIGQAANGQYVMVSVPGVSGKSGLTGSQLPALADHLGLTAAVCLDGGGSRYLSYCGSIKTNTTRAVKNDIIIYRRKKATPAPDPEPDTKPDHQPDVAGDSMVMITDKGPLRIRNAVMGDKILYTVPQGEQIDILDMLPGRQKDGYQWAFVSYKPTGKDKIIGYSQVDGDYSLIDEKI